MTVLSSPMPSLAHLNLHAASMPTGAHYGVNSDAATPIAIIALSRLARTKDAPTLERMASSPLAIALLTALRSLTLRVALAAGFDQGLSGANIAALFNLPGSSTKYQSQYGDFGSLQSRLPWPQYKRLVSALLEALTTARQSQVGYVPGQIMLTTCVDRVQFFNFNLPQPLPSSPTRMHSSDGTVPYTHPLHQFPGL